MIEVSTLVYSLMLVLVHNNNNMVNELINNEYWQWCMYIQLADSTDGSISNIKLLAMYYLMYGFVPHAL